MAAKKKTTTKRRRSTTSSKVSGMRRRRSSSRSKMGALPVSVELIGGSVIGAIANRVIMANMAAPYNPNDTDVRPYVGIALGLGLMYVGKGNKVMEGAALGSIGDSVANMISAKYIPEFGATRIAGFKSNTIAGNSQGFQNNAIGVGHHRMLQNNRMGKGKRNRLALNGINGNGERIGYDGM